jgi:Protein of unknown function (DUF1592)/Protein of unknown function (DUF1588)/Protein of unknown function (DUF1595)/Protein of unknown function (DUF1587)/Protein of unknown function (DUF1585)
MNARSWSSGLLAVLLCVACDGYVSGPPEQRMSQQPPGGLGSAGGSGTAGQLGAPVTLPTGCDAQAPLRRLTNFEYARTLQDLFVGYDLGKPADTIPGDTSSRELVFDNQAALQGVSAQHVDGYGKVAERVAALVTNDAKLTGCDPISGSDECFQTFLKPFVERAFRRPASTDELSRITTTFISVKAMLGFQEAERAALERILQSPQFLYRLEAESLPTPGKATALSAYELATRLSYLVWGSMPDAELSTAASTGALAMPGALATHAARLLGDPRARSNFDHLSEQWLNLRAVPNINKDLQRFPRFNSNIARLMGEETRTFFERVLFDGEGGVQDLLSANYTYANRPLAEYYGLSGPAADTFERVALPAGRTLGFLGQGAFTALYATDKTTHPIKRGAFVRMRLLCDALPSPPANVPPAPEFTGTETARELSVKHRAAPTCAACHDLIDPIGLGLENLDAAGIWRDTDVNGKPVDASGELRDGGDATGAFVGASELGAKLGDSAQVRACVATQLFRFGFGRDPGAGDQCALQALSAPAAATQALDYRELLRRLVASDAFLLRTN